MLPILLSRFVRLVVLGALAAASGLAAAADVQATAERAARFTLARFQSPPLLPEQLALTVVDLTDPARPVQGSVRGTSLIYPASIIKLFYLAAAHRWMEDGRLADTPELRRAMKDMIVDSSNDATHYIIDLLTGTTSGPELAEPELKLWFERRNVVTAYFTELGYTGVIAHKKPWGDGPYGRESQAIKTFEPKRNMLTTDATARLLVEIATGRCVTAERSAQMLQLMQRDISRPSRDPDDQATFTGPALPANAKLWSKAGWTSQTRHDSAYVELPDGRKLVYVIFTEKHSGRSDILQTAARALVEPQP